MFLKPCAAETARKDDSSNLEESLEAVSSKPCSANATIEGDSSKIEEAVEPMEVSPVIVKSCLTKRKAEFEPEEEEEEEKEESHSEMEERIAKEVREAGKRYLVEPEWDVDSFEGVEYSSSSEPDLASDEQPYSDMEGAREDYRIQKRQLIESKGFKMDPGLRPSDTYMGIIPETFERETYRNTCKEMVSICLKKYNQCKDLNVKFVELVIVNYRGGPRSKSYITFMAREKPGGPLVEYQAKAMRTLDLKIHPILCRPVPLPKS